MVPNQDEEQQESATPSPGGNMPSSEAPSSPGPYPHEGSAAEFPTDGTGVAGPGMAPSPAMDPGEEETAPPAEEPTPEENAAINKERNDELDSDLEANAGLFGDLDQHRKAHIEQHGNVLLDPRPDSSKQLLEEAYVQHVAARKETNTARKAALIDYENRLLIDAGVKAAKQE